MRKARRIKDELRKLNKSEFSNIGDRECEARNSLEDKQKALREDPMNDELQLA